MFNTEDFKKSVLDRAMRGKLTKQLSEDGDANALLNQIDTEKKALINDGKIKAQKPLPEITEDEIPFEIPDNWQWVRLGDIINMQIGKTPSRSNKEYWNGSIPWVSIRDINGDVLNETNDKITEQAAENTFSNSIAPKGTMLMSFKLSIGKVCILNMPAYHNEAIVSFYFFRHEEVIKEYLFKTIGYLSNFAKSNSAVKGKTLNKTSLNNMMIPMPPISEQKRIVESIDKCFDLAEQIDKEDSLTDKFNVDMRKSLLQSAMMGKLTKQLPEDGDASELLDQIKAEKEALVKAKKIKAQKTLPEITADEIPFEIPDNWRWVRLGDIGTWKSGSTPKRSHPEYYGGSINWLKTGDLNDSYINKTSEKITQEGVKDSNLMINPPGSVLIAMYGATIAKLGILNIESTTNQACCACKTYSDVDNEFLFYYLMSQRNNFIALGAGGAQPNISRTKIINYLIPLPPLSEQKRIVNKLDKLLDELKV